MPSADFFWLGVTIFESFVGIVNTSFSGFTVFLQVMFLWGTCTCERIVAMPCDGEIPKLIPLSPEKSILFGLLVLAPYCVLGFRPKKGAFI